MSAGVNDPIILNRHTLDIPDITVGVKVPKGKKGKLELNVPGVDIKGPKIGIDINAPKIGGDIKGPKIGLPNVDVDINDPKVGGGIDINGPKIGIPGIDIHGGK